MTERELRARTWAGAACTVAQIAATAAGMLPWWALPVTLTVTVVVSRPPGPINPSRAKITRSAGVACVATFAGLIAFRAIGAGGVGPDPTSTLRSLTEALVVLSLIMAPAATTPREHRVWLTVTTGVLVAAAAGGRTSTSALLNVGSWVVLLTAIAKVQTTAAYAGSAVVATVEGTPSQPTRILSLWRSDGLVPVLASLAAATVVFYALPSGLGGGGLARRIATRVSSGPGVPSETRDSVGVDTFGAGDLSLLVRGALPDTPIMRVPWHSPPLWRGTIYRDYTGVSWEDGFNDHFVSRGGPSTAVPLISADPAPVGRPETDRVTMVRGAHVTLIWAPGVITHLSGSSSEVLRVIRGDNNVRAIGLVSPATATYTVTSTVPTTRPAQLRKSSGADPSDPIWTQLPTTLPSSIGQLAHQLTTQATTRQQQVADIEGYLRSHETYSQNSPVPGPGQDAVAEFLFRDHVGFCEQFASAEAVMLRTLGVPARVVSGLGYGTRIGSTRLFTAANAHAWVEVYYPGIGWSPSDPTAGAQLAPPAVSHRSTFSRVMAAITAALPGGRLALGVAVALLIMLAGWLVELGRGERRRARRRPAAAARAPGPVLAAFLRLIRHPRAPGPPAAAETAREYLGRIGVPPQADGLIATLEQEMYGANPPDLASTDAAVAALDALTDDAAQASLRR